MAHKKAGGSSRNGRDSKGKRLGIKKYAGELVSAGNVLIRQRGSTYCAGPNTSLAKDFTIFALVDGKVQFNKGKRVTVTVVPTAALQPA